MRGARGKIANIELRNANGVRCRCALIDASRFALTVTGKINIALDATLHASLMPNEVAAKTFGIKIDWCPSNLFHLLTGAINAALTNGQMVAVEITDDAQDLQVWAYPALPDAISYESVGGGYVKGVVLRFIAAERIAN